MGATRVSLINLSTQTDQKFIENAELQIFNSLSHIKSSFLQRPPEVSLGGGVKTKGAEDLNGCGRF